MKKGKVGYCGGSASREVPLSELFKKELVKKTSEHLRNKRAREDESSMCSDKFTSAEFVKSRSKTGGDSSKPLGKRSRFVEVVDSEDSEQMGEEDGENASKEQNKMHICDDDVNGSYVEKKTMTYDGTKKVECLLHGNGVKQRSNDDDDERWKERKLVKEELALNLDARMMKVQKTLAIISKWKTSRNQIENGVLRLANCVYSLI